MRSKSFLTVLASILTLGITTDAGAEPAAWELISKIEITEVEKDDQWQVKKSYPDALRAQADSFRIRGFYVPVEAQAYVKSFLLVPDPADCPFCGNGGYGLSLEVHVSKAMPDMAEGTDITVEGRLELVESDETYQAVILRDARLVK